MFFSSQALISGLFGNEAAIYVVLTVVGLLMVATFVVGLIVLVLKNINRQWPIR
jgi:flagellar biosynthesis protein FliQ